MRDELKQHTIVTAARWLRQAFVVGLLPIFAAGCDGLLEVENPTNLLDEDLERPQLEEALGNSGEASLAGAYGAALVNGEMLGDQVFHVSSQDFAILLDQGDRRTANSAVEGMYNNLASALAIADQMVVRLTAMVDDPSDHLGIARNYFWGGAARVVLISYFEELTYDGGPPVPPAQALRDAIERYESAAAIAAAAGDANLEAGAYGAIARAYRGIYFEELHHGAGADPTLFEQAETFARRALDTQADFSVNLRYGSPGTVNTLYNNFNVGFRHRPTPHYYERLDPVSGEPDPRILLSPLVELGVRGEAMHDQLKWTSFTTPLAVSRAGEAELIVAEARLVAGDPDGAIQWINRVRDHAGLADFPGGDAETIRQQIIYERDTELWLEGRAWEDHRYYGIVPQLKWSDVQKQIGVHQRFEVSVQERSNNPNYSN